MSNLRGKLIDWRQSAEGIQGDVVRTGGGNAVGWSAATLKARTVNGYGVSVMCVQE
ncbi:MAG: hypothetical protein GXY61_08970 [Lentisphaerae bacterium]|nr:hypothetical protein [Lentisphaerota bacterium]